MGKHSLGISPWLHTKSTFDDLFEKLLVDCLAYQCIYVMINCLKKMLPHLRQVRHSILVKHLP